MKKILNLVLIILILIGATACKREDESTQLRIAYFANITHAQALIMKSQGRLEEKLGESCEVTWTAFNAGPAVIEAMFAGKIDLAYIGPVPAINAYMKSEGDVRIIAGAANGGAVLVSRKDVSIENISELKGKTIAVPQFGNTQHLLLLKLLAEHGLDTVSNGGSVNVIAVQNADVQSLMEKGELDAALVPEPWGSVLEGNIEANLVLDANELWKNGNYATAVVLVSKDYLDENRNIIKDFLEAHKEVTLYINENQEEAKQIINDQIEQVTSKVIQHDILDKAFSRMTVSDEIMKNSIMEYANVSMEAGLIKEVPDTKLMDSSLLEEIK